MLTLASVLAIVLCVLQIIEVLQRMNANRR
jgi:hypothetical protein